jgi:signal transduction histidine kinase
MISTQQGGSGESGARDGTVRGAAVRALRATVVSLEQLAGALGTAALALAVLICLSVATLTIPIGIGLVLAPVALRGLHAVADRERARLTRWGSETITPGPLPTQLRLAAADPTTRRELRWLAGHATGGLLLGAFAVLLPLYALQDITFLLWWQLVPEGEAASPTFGLWVVSDWAGAFAVALMGVGWLAIAVGLTPIMARLQIRHGARLLAPGPDVDLSLRITELTATRAAALDAHATELRRIERALHDGTQNRLVAVTILLGAARRVLTRDPAAAEAILDQAQGAAEQALAELRAVARGILPPVLVDRGLAGALTGLAVSCPVPCEVDVDVPDRCAASVEATAYFVVAEALTNISRHSGATRAGVVVSSRNERLSLLITDDGAGGADENSGSGLLGIRRRIEAHDGTLTVVSPPGGPTTLTVELPCGL